MTLPIAALGALIAALIETSIAPELMIAGAQADIVFALAVLAAMLIGIEDGLVWAFLGGLMLDMLIPARPIGATALSLLLVVGVAGLAARLPGPRRLTAGIAVFVLTWLFHLVLIGVMAMTEGVRLSSFQPMVVLTAALINSIIALIASVGFDALGRRFEPERADW